MKLKDVNLIHKNYFVVVVVVVEKIPVKNMELNILNGNVIFVVLILLLFFVVVLGVFVMIVINQVLVQLQNLVPKKNVY